MNWLGRCAILCYINRLFVMRGSIDFRAIRSQQLLIVASYEYVYHSIIVSVETFNGKSNLDEKGAWTSWILSVLLNWVLKLMHWVVSSWLVIESTHPTCLTVFFFVSELILVRSTRTLSQSKSQESHKESWCSLIYGLRLIYSSALFVVSKDQSCFFWF